jgi:hypothetical protein
VLHSTRDSHWATENGSPGDELQAIWGSGPNDIYAVGQLGWVYHSNGTGVWTATLNPFGNNFGLSAVWGSGATDVYLLGSGVLHGI